MTEELSLEETIFSDMNKALKNRDSLKLSTLRMMRAAIKNAEISKKGKLTEEEIIAILRNNLKKAEESLDFFIQGERLDLVEKTKREIEIMKGYLPPQLSEEEIVKIAKEIIIQYNFKGPQDLGAAMKEIMPRLRGKAEGKLVNKVMRDLLDNLNN